jgi:DNA-binding GntR family transcriptional regulator
MPPNVELHPIVRQPLRTPIADRLRDSILSGAFAPGDKIVELTIANQLGVSRAPLREALWQLAKEGLVRFEPNRGAYVTDLSERDINDIFDVRESLEVRAALLIHERQDPKAYEELERSCVVLEKAAAKRDMKLFAEADMAFHRTIWKLSGNALIEEILSNVSARFFAYGLIRDVAKADKYEFDKVVAEHRKIARLIRLGPPEKIIRGVQSSYRVFRDYTIERLAKRRP